MIVANDTVRVWKEGIPEHWQVMPLKHAITYNEDKLSDQSDDEYEFDYVDIGSVTYGKGIETYQHMKFGDAPSRARRIVQPKDVIMSTVRTYLKLKSMTILSSFPQVLWLCVLVTESFFLIF